MITLTVNGAAVHAPESMSVLLFLELRSISVAAVAVAHNGAVLHRSEYGTTVVHEGDRLEIVRMVGGGWGGAPRLRSAPPGLGSLLAGDRGNDGETRAGYGGGWARRRTHG